MIGKALQEQGGNGTIRAMGRFKLLQVPILALIWLVLTPQASADTLSGTVKDPSGAVVAGASIEITGGNLPQALVLTSDETGKFAAANLSAGKYSVRVAKDGFDDLVREVDLKGTAELALSLTITAQQTRVTVNEKSAAFANSDAIYRQLRNEELGETFRCENFILSMDVGTFELKSGTLTLLKLVNRFETGAVFSGRDISRLNPSLPSTPTRWCGAAAVRRPRKTSRKWSFVSPPTSFRNSPRRSEPERTPRPRPPLRFSVGRKKFATATRYPKV